MAILEEAPFPIPYMSTATSSGEFDISFSKKVKLLSEEEIETAKSAEAIRVDIIDIYGF
mgnify:CR=1 FL=1